MDPQGERFYRLAAHFTTKPELTLAYVGKDVNNFPVHLRTWDASEIPGGVPKTSGWHRMRLSAVGEQFWAYWDDKELPGGPAIDYRIRSGYFGVYANFVGGRQNARTLVDALVVYQ